MSGYPPHLGWPSANGHDEYEDEEDVSYDEDGESSNQPVASTSTAKRSAPSKGGSSKRAKVADDEAGLKPKAVRAKASCLVCRKLKMRCVDAENGPPCRRCKAGGHECIFEESQRGRRRNMKADALAKSVKQMESTLATVLEALGTNNPKMLQAAAGMISVPSSNSEEVSPSAPPNSLPPALATAVYPARMPPMNVQSSAPPGWPGAIRQLHSRPPSPRLHSLPPHNSLNPLGLLAEASLHSGRSGDHAPLNPITAASDVVSGSAQPAMRGLANKSYFRPGPMSILPVRKVLIESRLPPTILTDGIVNNEEVAELFTIFFTQCAMHNAMLSAEFHTPQAVGARSPFLFTCLCAVASRYYSKRPDLYHQIMPIAKKMSLDVLGNSFKSVEIVQGFLLLSVWSQPSERYEDDNAFMNCGIAVRMAYDLNLYRRTQISLPPDADDATRLQAHRELLNRERTWLYAFTVDRSLSVQTGKPPSIREDAIIRSPATWCAQPGSIISDPALYGMVDLHRRHTRIMDTLAAVMDSRTGVFHPGTDVALLMRVCADSMEEWASTWKPALYADPAVNTYPGIYVQSMCELYLAYYGLVPLSFGYQHALLNPSSGELAASFQACYGRATSVVEQVCTTLGPGGYLRYATDPILTFTAYAGVFLLKLIRPGKTNYADEEHVLGLVSRLADTLNAAAVDAEHTPALYATFLRHLIEARKEAAANSRAQTRQGSPAAGAQPHAAPSRRGSVQGNGVAPQLDPSLSMDPSATTAPGSASGVAGGPAGTEAWWDSMIFPGFGGSMGGLNASGGQFAFDADPWATGLSSVVHSAGPASPVSGQPHLYSDSNAYHP